MNVAVLFHLVVTWNTRRWKQSDTKTEKEIDTSTDIETSRDELEISVGHRVKMSCVHETPCTVTTRWSTCFTIRLCLFPHALELTDHRTLTLWISINRPTNFLDEKWRSRIRFLTNPENRFEMISGNVKGVAEARSWWVRDRRTFCASMWLSWSNTPIRKNKST